MATPIATALRVVKKTHDWIDASATAGRGIIESPTPARSPSASLHSALPPCCAALTPTPRHRAIPLAPLRAPRAYCALRTLEAAGLHVRPYQARPPSAMGFALARQRHSTSQCTSAAGARFLATAPSHPCSSSPRQTAVTVEINRIDNKLVANTRRSGQLGLVGGRR